MKFRDSFTLPTLVVIAAAGKIAVAETTVVPSADATLRFEADSNDLPLNLGMIDSTTSAAVPYGASPWRVDLTTWIWLTSMSGEVGARGTSADADASFGDILDASDSLFGFSGRLEVGYKRFGVFIDGTYMKVGVDDVSVASIMDTVDITSEIGTLDFGLMYRILEWTPDPQAWGNPAANPHTPAVDVYAGGRWFSTGLELDPSASSAQSRDVDWIDPIVGARLTLPFAENLHLLAGGDVGGFGVNADFTWSALAAVAWDFRLFDLPCSAYLGYRALGEDYSEGSGDTAFEWDVVLHGPMLGFGVRF